MFGRLQFGIYELDRDAMQLRKDGELIALQEQPLRLLAALLQRPGEIISREELQERIWGKDTFVDFEASLNKVVNRLREALNDEAAEPRYVQTVPRRGYRFVAPVIAPRAAQTSPAHLNATSEAEPTVTQPPRVRRATLAITGIAVMLAAIGVTAALWRWRPRQPALPETKYITSAAMCCSRLSRDGKLLAYVSPVGGGPPHIWVQQTAGGDAIQVTRGSDGEIGPDFSPDGTHLAFVCNGGICIAPTLSGERKQLVKDGGGWPVFSPNGQKILYRKDNRAMIIAVNGSEQASLDVDRDFLVHGPPLWSPGGDQILFYGVRKQEQDKPDGWWIAPLTAGQARPLPLPDMEQLEDRDIAARAWLRREDGSQWIVYSRQKGEVWKLFRIEVSADGEIRGKPQQITHGVGELGYSVSIADDGKLVYPTFSSQQSTYEIPIDAHGEKLGPILQLSLSEAADSYSPSTSRNGRWMAYLEDIPGRSNNIVLRDLRSGANRVLNEASRRSNYGVAISADGSKVSFEQDCKNGRWQSGENVNCGFVVSAATGESDRVCEACIPRGFSSTGSVVLVRKYNPLRDDKPPSRIVAVDLRSKTEKEFLATPDKAIESASFSWDDRWIVFAKRLDPPRGQIMIAPVRDGAAAGEAEWIAVTDGRYNDAGPQFSADGNLVYFTSARDGYHCIWAQKLDAVRKRPVGEPFAYEHFHNSSQQDLAGFWNGDQADLSVARDKILVNLVQWRVRIWMTQVE